jgi:hypothetical protein
MSYQRLQMSGKTKGLENPTKKRERNDIILSLSLLRTTIKIRQLKVTYSPDSKLSGLWS